MMITAISGASNASSDVKTKRLIECGNNGENLDDTYSLATGSKHANNDTKNNKNESRSGNLILNHHSPRRIAKNFVTRPSFSTQNLETLSTNDQSLLVKPKEYHFELDSDLLNNNGSISLKRYNEKPTSFLQANLNSDIDGRNNDSFMPILILAKNKGKSLGRFNSERLFASNNAKLNYIKHLQQQSELKNLKSFQHLKRNSSSNYTVYNNLHDQEIKLNIKNSAIENDNNEKQV